MKRETTKGIALISILALTTTLLAILVIGLRIGSDGVLFVSQVHKRNVALSAAEAGVYEAIIALENDKTFSGTLTGTLTDSRGSYHLEVENELFTSRVARVTSTGKYGSTKRTLKVELEPDSAGFGAISLAGRVYVFDQAYVNAIVSPSNPITRPGHSHTEYSGSEPAFVGEDFNSDGTSPTLRASGTLSTRGFFDSNLNRISRQESSGTNKPQYRLDPVEMASGSFTSASSVSAGTLAGNTEISGDVEISGELIVPKGVTLVVHGDAKFLGGLSGEGQVVVDGDVLIRTTSNFNPNLEEGIKLHAGESVFLSHPQTEIAEGEIVGGEFNEVGDFFAQMPLEASTELSIDIPVLAPKGGSFFSWFDENVDSPNSEFNLWYNGDGTDIHPGLSEETKTWLQQSRGIHTEIAAWASGT